MNIEKIETIMEKIETLSLAELDYLSDQIQKIKDEETSKFRYRIKIHVWVLTIIIILLSIGVLIK